MQQHRWGDHKEGGGGSDSRGKWPSGHKNNRQRRRYIHTLPTLRWMQFGVRAKTQRTAPLADWWRSWCTNPRNGHKNIPPQSAPATQHHTKQHTRVPATATEQRRMMSGDISRSRSGGMTFGPWLLIRAHAAPPVRRDDSARALPLPFPSLPPAPPTSGAVL